MGRNAAAVFGFAPAIVHGSVEVSSRMEASVYSIARDLWLRSVTPRPGTKPDAANGPSFPMSVDREIRVHVAPRHAHGAVLDRILVVVHEVKDIAMVGRELHHGCAHQLAAERRRAGCRARHGLFAAI